MGVTEQPSDEEAAAAAVQTYLSDYLGQVYVEEYFSAEAKAGVVEMIDDILAVYEDRIEDLDWMSETTKEKAIKKLDAITVKVGYPDEWDDVFDDVDLRTVEEGGSYYENVIAMNKAVWTEAVAEFDQPVDKDAWGMAAYTVNAYYDTTANSINFPVGILQAPLYDVEADYTENLGGIGYIIAHEITHAFDNNGAQFDAEGNQNNWWTEEDYAAFQALCADVVDFYDGIEAIPGVACNGALTISENVADLGALACVTQIEGQEKQPDYQTLYESVARTWRSAASREMRTYLSTLDVHTPISSAPIASSRAWTSSLRPLTSSPGTGCMWRRRIGCRCGKPCRLSLLLWQSRGRQTKVLPLPPILEGKTVELFMFLCYSFQNRAMVMR